jgi:DNA invertase Pin-like site-specific DNA recombinase
VHELRQKGVALKATEQPIDTSNAAGKAFLDMLGVFAEFETNLRRERQLEGIAKAKAEGVYKGRKPSIDVARVKALRASGIGPAAIAKQLKMAAGRQQAGAAVGGLGGRGSISASIAWPMRSGASPIGSSP